MPASPEWLAIAATNLASSDEPGSLLLCEGPLDSSAAGDLRTLAEAHGLKPVVVSARTWGLLPMGVARASIAGWIGEAGASADPAFCQDAVGEGAAARAAWDRLQQSWKNHEAGSGLPLPPDDALWRRDVELMARLLAAVGEVEPRLLVVEQAEATDDSSLRILCALLAGRSGSGWTVVLEATEDCSPLVQRLVQTVERSRPEGGVLRITAPVSEDDSSPGLPKRGSAVELLDVLSAAPVPLPAAVVGSAALASYRGSPPRAGWLDLQGLIDAERVRTAQPLLELAGAWSPSTDADSEVARADCRALRQAVAEVLSPDSPIRVALEARLAGAGAAPDAHELALEAALAALGRGDAWTALRWLDTCPDPPPLHRARAARLSGDAERARQICTDAIRSESEPGRLTLLHLEAGRAALALDRTAAATKQFSRAAELAESQSLDDELAAARLLQARVEEDEGDFGPAARNLAEAAQACERSGRPRESARAFARRAVCMGKAGSPERAMKELQLARERAGAADDPHPAALDVRISMGVVFRDSGSRDNARKALALAAGSASADALPDREAEARLLLARFLLEAIPVKGKERGEAIRDGREAAEAVVALGRGMLREDLEAEGEALLGELSWRAEDWPQALASLERQQALWGSIGRAARELDVAIRRSRLSGRQGAWEDAFAAANQALTLASRRQRAEQSAQAQVARAEALEQLDRGSEALAALSEAQRIFGSLGAGFERQVAAAEERAQRLVERGRSGKG